MHLPVDGNFPMRYIHIRPFQAVALIDTQAAIPAKQVRRFCIGALKVFIQHGKLRTAERHNIHIIIGFQLWHTYLCVLVHTELIVCVYVEIVTGICLTENQIEHF